MFSLNKFSEEKRDIRPQKESHALHFSDHIFRALSPEDAKRAPYALVPRAQEERKIIYRFERDVVESLFSKDLVISPRIYS